MMGPMASSSSWCRAISWRLETRLSLCSDRLRIRSRVMLRVGFWWSCDLIRLLLSVVAVVVFILVGMVFGYR